MKTTIYCLAIAIFFSWIFNIKGQELIQEPKTYFFQYKLTGENWLEIHRHNHKGEPDAWNPSFTSITCNYRPIVIKHGDGNFEIVFVSEIARNLP